MGLHDLAAKSESYEICFIPDNDYRSFLKNRIPDLEQQLLGGNFVDRQGNVLGQHKGYPFYTIGQRKGLEIAIGSALYVTEIRPDTNTVVLGEVEELQQQAMQVRDINLVKYASLPAGMEATTKIRYKDPGTMSTLEQVGNRVSVIFHAPVKAVAPGQSAVFYEGDDVLGGGFIEKGNVRLS
jgi:tRNA-specific 2-thiouridylase